MTNTIKEHLAKAIEKNDRLCKLGNGDRDGNSNGNVIAQDIREHLAAIEAKLDAPMIPSPVLVMDKTKRQAVSDWNNERSAYIIRDCLLVPQRKTDAIASKLPDVRTKPPLTKEHAAWVADKIHALGDYAREAAWMLNNWPDASKLPEVDLRGLAKTVAVFWNNQPPKERTIKDLQKKVYAALLKARGGAI